MTLLFVILFALYGAKAIGETTFVLSSMALLVFALVYYIVYAVGAYKMFAKANIPGWLAFIPFVGDYETYKISWEGKFYLVVFVLDIVANVITRNGTGTFTFWTAIAMAASLVALVIEIIYVGKLSKAYGKGTGFAVGLFILRPIFIMILGFGKAEYKGIQA